MSVVVVATMIPKPEFREEVIAALEAGIAKTHAEETGIELYALHTGKDRLVMIEKYTDRDALATHGKGENVAAIGAALVDKLASPMDLQVLRPHPVGDATLGQL